MKFYKNDSENYCRFTSSILNNNLTTLKINKKKYELIDLGFLFGVFFFYNYSNRSCNNVTSCYNLWLIHELSNLKNKLKMVFIQSTENLSPHLRSVFVQSGKVQSCNKCLACIFNLEKVMDKVDSFM